MKRLAIIVVALALVLGLVQCKKENPNGQNGNEGNRVHITVKVGGNSSKADINPATGDVTFRSGDKLYVGYNNACVGALNFDGSSFSGDITLTQSGNQRLYFYYLGGMEATIEGGVYSVSINNQTTAYPVISCGQSSVDYSDGVKAYSTTLFNQCALVKFNVTTSSTAATCITGFKNKVAVDFLGNTITSSIEGDGLIKLPAGNGEKWAILLPQDALEAGGTGTAYSADGSYRGTRGAVPAITENGYYTDGIQVQIQIAYPVLNHEYVDLGLPSGLLWATCNVGANAPEEYGDYFAWGETQSKSTYDWSSYQYCNGYSNTLIKYCNNASYGYNGFTDNLITLSSEDDAATANWGTEWRMPTMEEWQELLDNTTPTWMAQNGVNGMLFTSNNGNSLFLPAAGYREYHVLSNAGSYGRYWSSSLNLINPSSSWNLFFSAFDKNIRAMDRDTGRPIRPVHSSFPNTVLMGVINGNLSINSNGDQ